MAFLYRERTFALEVYFFLDFARVFTPTASLDEARLILRTPF